MSEENRSFTATEVGTLVDSFRKDLSVVAEGVSMLLSWKEKVDVRLDRVDSRLDSIEGRLDAIFLVIPPLSQRVSRLESKLGI